MLSPLVIVIIVLLPVAGAAGYLLGRRARPETPEAEASDLPDLKGREDRVRDGAVAVRQILIRLAGLVSQVDSAAEGSTSKLTKSRMEVDRIAKTKNLEIIQSTVLREIDRVIHTNGTLRRELDKTRTTLEAQKNEIEVLHAAIRVDSLTGVANRAAFDETLDHAMTRYSRYGDHFSLLMIDVDHFKSVNDTHGHQVGDHILQRIASKLKAALRATDFIGRYGGEEFSVVLERAEMMHARAVAEELRRNIEATQFTTRENARLKVTVSVGVAAVAEGDSPATLVERADRALYHAKQQGRNRIAYIDSNLDATTDPTPPAPRH